MNLDKLGIRCGLEIHQQIEGKKLFCDCPTIIRDDSPDKTVLRRLRVSAGEMGELDAAAKHEARKDKTFLYEVYDDTTCLVELDEEPPHALNEDALNLVLEFSAMVHAKLLDQVHVMRKTIVNGSNTSAFQRTALVARNGHMLVQGQKISLPTICLEEDAARTIRTTTTETTYRLDRLGIPLIEIATGPDMTTPAACLAVAKEIGMYLRSTGKVKRGLGTIRQDVNVSIKGGCRVEIKGAQELRIIDKLVEYEALRQHNLLELFKVLKKKKAHVHDIQDVTHIFSATAAKVIKAALDKQGVVLGMNLSGFKEFLGREIQPGRRLGTEYSDHAKRMGAGGLFHGDELPKYGITQEEVDLLRTALQCGKEDSFIIIADTLPIARRAITAVHDRAAILELQQEVRNANPDGTSSFLRPMSGGSRMYPETDIPPFFPKARRVSVELWTQKQERYVKQYGLAKDLARDLISAEVDMDFLQKTFSQLKPAFMGDVITSSAQELSMRNVDDNTVSSLLWSGQSCPPLFAEALKASNEGSIPQEKAAVFDFLAKRLRGEEITFVDIADDEIMIALKKLLAEKPDLSKQALMGLAMQQFRGKVSGKKIAELLSTLHDKKKK
ncbi:MAG: Glu-tRNA(Gln) amidotransferase subunit GatE [archaeon]